MAQKQCDNYIRSSFIYTKFNPEGNLISYAIVPFVTALHMRKNPHIIFTLDIFKALFCNLFYAKFGCNFYPFEGVNYPFYYCLPSDITIYCLYLNLHLS